MKKIENQVCTLEQAKKLRELGVEQKSLFYWENVEEHHGHSPDKWYLQFVDYDNKKIWDKTYSAFSVAELGVMLPKQITFNRSQKASLKIISFLHHGWCIRYDRHSSGQTVTLTENSNEAIARADMLIRLIEFGYVKVEEINQRLSEIG